MSFWIWASVLTVAALLLLLVPLIRRAPLTDIDREQANVDIYKQRLAQLELDKAAGKLSSDEYQAGQLEAQRQLLADTEAAVPTGSSSSVPIGVIALACAVALPLAALLLYGQFGNSDALATALQRQHDKAMSLQQANNSENGSGGSEQTAAELREATNNRLASLEADVRRTPLKIEAWGELAIAYQQAGRPKSAADAWGQANTLAKGQNPDVLLGYGETLALMAGGRFAGQPAALVERALRLEPDSPRGLWFGGMAAAEAQDFAALEQRWGKLASMEGVPEGTQKILQRALQSARQQLAAQGVEVDVAGDDVPPMLLRRPPQDDFQQPAPAVPNRAREAAPGEPGIPGMLISVKLDEAIAAKVLDETGNNATLFVYAKAQSGPPMPLAIKRLTAAQLPLKVALTDRDAMMPSMTLSSVKAWTVIARISPTGSATPQPGDWLAQKQIEGELVDVPAFELVIDTKL